jgi:hypothetical protein
VGVMLKNQNAPTTNLYAPAQLAWVERCLATAEMKNIAPRRQAARGRSDLTEYDI